MYAVQFILEYAKNLNERGETLLASVLACACNAGQHYGPTGDPYKPNRRGIYSAIAAAHRAATAAGDIKGADAVANVYVTPSGRPAWEDAQQRAARRAARRQRQAA
jgi:hypothetical protein